MMHYYGDDWPYWNDLYKAESFIADYVYKHSWCRAVLKEKYGTLRYGWVFPPKGGFYTRKYACIRVPFLWTHYDKEKRQFKWVFDKSRILGYPIWRWGDSWLYKKWENYGWRTLEKAIDISVQKWPQCADEIANDFKWRKK